MFPSPKYGIPFIAIGIIMNLTGCKGEQPPQDYDQPENIEETTVEPEEQTGENQQQLSLIDYYYLIPEGYLGFSQEEREAMLSIESGAIIDEANYYLKPAAELYRDGSIEMAVFIKPDGSNLIALSTKTCGPMCHQTFNIFDYEQETNTWNEITGDIFPLMPAEEFEDAHQAIAKSWASQDPTGTQTAADYDEPLNPIYTIPRYNTTIEVYDQYSQTLLFQVEWRNGQFIREEVEIEYGSLLR